MTFNKNNKPVTSASQFSIYTQNVRSLGTQITSRKFTRPLDLGCDVYIFVDARVTELRVRQLWSNFKVRMSDMQLYNTNSLNRGILIICKKSSACTIKNARGEYCSHPVYFIPHGVLFKYLKLTWFCMVFYQKILYRG